MGATNCEPEGKVSALRLLVPFLPTLTEAADENTTTGELPPAANRLFGVATIPMFDANEYPAT